MRMILTMTMTLMHIIRNNKKRNLNDKDDSDCGIDIINEV